MVLRFEELRVLQAAEAVADGIWRQVVRWDRFARDVVGGQLAKAADSIGANTAEAYGRFHYGEKLQFLYYARGSLPLRGDQILAQPGTRAQSDAICSGGGLRFSVDRPGPPTECLYHQPESPTPGQPITAKSNARSPRRICDRPAGRRTNTPLHPKGTPMAPSRSQYQYPISNTQYLIIRRHSRYETR